MIKDAIMAKPDKILRANLFNNTILFVMLYTNKMWGIIV